MIKFYWQQLHCSYWPVKRLMEFLIVVWQKICSKLS